MRSFHLVALGKQAVLMLLRAMYVLTAAALGHEARCILTLQTAGAKLPAPAGMHLVNHSQLAHATPGIHVVHEHQQQRQPAPRWALL